MPTDMAHPPSPSSASDAPTVSWVKNLTRKLRNVLQHTSEPIEDPELAHGLALAIKPYVDRQAALNNLLKPVDDILSKQELIKDLQDQVRDQVAQIQEEYSRFGPEGAAGLANELEAGVSELQKDRKIVPPASSDREVRPANGSRRPFLERPLIERFSAIFGDRFISPEALEDLFSCTLPSEDKTAFHAGLEGVWQTVFAPESLEKHLASGNVQAIRNTFTDYALLPRITRYQEDKPCSLASLRLRFPSYFLQGSERGQWYVSLPLYKAPVEFAHWALVDRQYLNCTFKKPAIRLMMYAQANELPAKMLVQKSLTEDIYDRIVLYNALQDPFFDVCNSLCRTFYQAPGESTRKQAYTYMKDSTIRISGKKGLPHWRPGKPRWPGLLPAAVFKV